MNGIIEPIVVSPVKHIYKMLTQKNYFEYSLLSSQLKNKKRYQEQAVKVNKWNLLIPDNASFLSAYEELLLNEIYKFETKKNKPKILDLGANIGLSILFFKELYPESEVIAYEADPKIFNYLKNNVHNNGYKDVQLINKAVWSENATLNFCSDGADGGRINSDVESRVTVEAVDIAEVLKNDRFDFIKMDIEGAENLVIPRCEGLLSSVQYFFVEYHSKVGQKQNLNEILDLLSKEGFRVYLQNPWNQPTPFIRLESYAGFDFQINIYAWKE